MTTSAAGERDGDASTTPIRWICSDVAESTLEAMAAQTGLAATVSPADRLVVAVTVDGRRHYDPVHRRLTDEHYRLSVDPADVARVTLDARSRRALRWGMVDVARRRAVGQLSGEHEAMPAFRIRGVIEGFYGPPWSDEQRLDIIDFLGAHRFNTFMFAPKDDASLRDRWQGPHDAEAAQRMRVAIDRCHGNDVDAMVGVSPGLSIQYSREADLEALDAKVLGLVDAGADRIALLFDDIPPYLQHRADVQRYRSLAEAHADIAGHVAELLDSRSTPLALCPTVYHGRGDEEYVVTLGALLDGRVDLLWTGRAICSPAITAAEAVEFARGTLRRPLYWDNYPVNDVAMTHQMHIGPYRGRDPILDRFSEGIMSNAMEHPEASKIALSTIADYLWAPDAYDPEASWERAIAEAGGPDAPALRRFADTVRGSCLAEPDTVLLGAELERFEFDLAHGDAAAARSRLAGVAAELAAAAAKLLSPETFNPRLARETRPWLEKFAVGAEAIAALAGVGVDPRAVAEIRRAALELERRPHEVFGTELVMAIDHALSATCPPAPTTPGPSQQGGDHDHFLDDR